MGNSQEKVRLPPPTTFPHTWDLRRSQCFPYPPVLNQREEGSCIVHAVSAAMQCAKRRQFDNYVDTPPLPIERIYASARQQYMADYNGPEGATFGAIFNTMNDIHPVRIHQDVENVKSALLMGYPVVVGFLVTEPMREWESNPSLMERSGNVLPPFRASDRRAGAHAVLLVGYSDLYEGGTFIARNSWGEEWGWRGHFMMSYDMVADDTVCKDVWIIY